MDLSNLDKFNQISYSFLTCGYGLVVECVLAKDETGVRFSLAAQKSGGFLWTGARRREVGSIKNPAGFYD